MKNQGYDTGFKAPSVFPIDQKIESARKSYDNASARLSGVVQSRLGTADARASAAQSALESAIGQRLGTAEAAVDSIGAALQSAIASRLTSAAEYTQAACPAGYHSVVTPDPSGGHPSMRCVPDVLPGPHPPLPRPMPPPIVPGAIPPYSGPPETTGLPPCPSGFVPGPACDWPGVIDPTMTYSFGDVHIPIKWVCPDHSVPTQGPGGQYQCPIGHGQPGTIAAVGLPCCVPVSPGPAPPAPRPTVIPPGVVPGPAPGPSPPIPSPTPSPPCPAVSCPRPVICRYLLVVDPSTGWEIEYTGERLPWDGQSPCPEGWYGVYAAPTFAPVCVPESVRCAMDLPPCPPGCKRIGECEADLQPELNIMFNPDAQREDSRINLYYPPELSAIWRAKDWHEQMLVLGRDRPGGEMPPELSRFEGP